MFLDEDRRVIRFGFAILLLLLCFSPLIEGGTSHLPVTLLRLTLIFLLTIWVVASVQQGVLRVYGSPLHFPTAVFLILAALTTLRSPYLHMSLQWLGSLFSYAVFFFLVYHWIDRRRRIDLAVYAVIVIGCIEATMGGLQSIVLESGRAKGTFFNPNFFAVYLVAISGLVLGLLTFSPRYNWRMRVILWGVLVLLVATILYSGSRGGWLALLLTTGCVVWFRFGKVAIACVLAVALALTVLPTPLQVRVWDEHQHNPYTYSRVKIWSSSITRAVEHPLGTGLGIYKYTSQRYPVLVEGVLSRYGTRAQTAHNEYLQILVELGVVGLYVFVWGMSRMGRSAYAALANPRLSEERGLLIGLTSGMLGMFAHAAVDSTFHQPPVVLLLILFGAMILSLNRMACREERVSVFVVRPTKFIVCGIYIIAVLIGVVAIRPALAWYAWVDSQRVLAEKDIDGAHGRLDLAVLLAPGNATYYDTRAEAAFQQLRVSGNWAWGEEAVAWINDAASLNIVDGRYRSHRGHIYRTMADVTGDRVRQNWALENARASYAEAIDLDPYSPRHYLERARANIALGNTQEAQDDLVHAIRLEPNYLPARFGLGHLYQQLGQKAEAAAEYQEIINRADGFREKTLIPMEKGFLDVDISYVREALAGLGTP